MRFNTLNCCEALPQMFLQVYQHAFSIKSIDLYIVYFFISLFIWVVVVVIVW
jgi:hypothetical protein